jgi:hypothetical protein
VADHATDRHLRVLFFAGGRKFDSRPYESLFSELTTRGHDVHLAFNKLPSDAGLARLQRLGSGAGKLTCGVAPLRGTYDGWRFVADLVRRLADLARYTHPRYDAAPALRTRMVSRILGHLSKPGPEPVGRRVALRLARRLASTSDAERSDRTIRWLARLEDAIPASGRITRYLREQAPDVVLATAVIKKPAQIEFLKSARRLRIPGGICVASWDNLTNKGLLKFAPERVFVWNEIQRREASELHGVPAERVVATGAQLFDEWFERTPSTSRDEFVRKVGLDPAVPYVVYVCSSAFITASGGEVEFVRGWIEALRASDEPLRSIGVLIRPHPGVPRRWRDADLSRYGNAVVWPSEGAHPVSERMRADFFDTIAHSASVVGINTTAMIEAAIIGKSVLTILAPEFAQESTIHFHYLLEENGGFLSVASSVDEHLVQVARLLDEDADAGERRRRFVESFVRPRGLDRPATPIFADEVEQLARIPVEAPRQPGRLLLRALLALEAALAVLAIPLDRRKRGLRRSSGRRGRSLARTTRAGNLKRGARERVGDQEGVLDRPVDEKRLARMAVPHPEMQEPSDSLRVGPEAQ